MDGCIRVLHVDDDSNFAELSVTFLQQADDRFAVETATGANEGLQELAETAFDCIVSDYDMPDKNGIEFLEAVRENAPDLPFILFTGKGNEEIASDAISAGVTDYLQKDSSTEQYELLANRIRNAVERSRTRRKLEERESHLRQAQAVANLGSWFKDIPSDEIHWSDEVYDIFGLSDDTVAEQGQFLKPTTGGQFMEYVHPEDRAYVDEKWSEALDGGGYDIEHRIVTGNDEVRWVRERADITFDRNGNPTVAHGVVQDITERRNRERTLTALHGAAREIGRADEPGAVYETLIETAEEVLDFDLVVVDIERHGFLVQEAWTLDIDQRGYWERTSLEADDTFAVRAYNRQETILVDDLRGADIAPADPEYRSALTVPIGEFGTFQAVFSEVAGFDERDREFAELLVDHARVKLSQLEDKQELHEQTEELERQNERLDNFASIVSHDLRNPLSVANLRLDLVAGDCDSEHIADIERAHDRIEQLIESLLTLARQGETVGETEVVELPGLVSRCWQTVENSSATIDCRVEGHVRADESRLAGVFENLFRNSVEHGGEDVTITVANRPEHDGFYVVDDGDGIPESSRDRLFESGYSTKNTGTGFGLAIVREIVESHGWEIRVTDSDDGGARFEITGVEFVSD